MLFFCIGRDATKAFITGEFDSSNLSDLDNILNLSPKEIFDLKQWNVFYNKQYVHVGYLIGRFYDKDGTETPYYWDVEKKYEIAIEEKRAAEAQKLAEIEFPPCNIEWKKETGTRVWCSESSGGIQRTWIGVPRKYYAPGAPQFRCACVRGNELTSPYIFEYSDCDGTSVSCVYKELEVSR